jgi:hypothetical protein
MNILDHISESLQTFFWLKILKVFYADPDPGSFGPWIRDLLDFGSGMKKSVSRIRDKLTVRTFTSIFKYIIKSIRSHKTVEIEVFLNFLPVDGRILIRSKNSGGSKTYGSYGIPDP